MKKRLIITVLTTAALISIILFLSKNNELDYLSDKGDEIYSDLKYEIGEEVTFDPGDGERTWNVIGEDNDTVTLMLTEYLGSAVAWYEHLEYDNNYGPKAALEYLNKLTENWDNVEPIKSYSYVNNTNEKIKPQGYQKIEIKDGVTTLTHKDGTTTKLETKSKARILSVEEVFEIAAKTNPNLTEEGLKAYITKNLEEINTAIGISATTADEVFDYFVQNDDYSMVQNESKLLQLHYFVLFLIEDAGIDTTHDALLPDYLCAKISDSQEKDGGSNLSLGEGTFYFTLPIQIDDYQQTNKEIGEYWTLSSEINDSYFAWIVHNSCRVSNGRAGDNDTTGVRPVIIISKSKLK